MAAAPTALEHGAEMRFEEETDEGYNGDTSEPRTATISRDGSPMPRNMDFPKSASYTYLPNAKDSAYGSVGSLPNTIKGSLSDDELVTPLDSADVSPPDSSGWTTPTEGQQTPTDVVNALVVELQKSPKFKVSSRSVPETEDDNGGGQYMQMRGREGSIGHPSTALPPKARLHEASFARRLSRRIAQVPSRSPSPKKRYSPVQSHEPVSNGGPTLPAAIIENRKSVLKKPEGDKKVEQITSSQKKPERRSTILRRRSTKSGSRSKPPAQLPSVLPKSFSTDRLPSLAETQHDDMPSPMPRMVSGERTTSFGSLALPRKRDELWGVFRSLEADYAKFTSKSTSLKANVVRASFLPFLRSYADHTSVRTLRAEDLDRRVNILNKWWTGLLEMLHGKNNQSLSGTDRPAILDALSGLMDRPEWRLAPSSYSPLADRNTDFTLQQSKSTNSLASMGSSFLLESVHHNVRNTFVQNLTAQMGFVADKMSLRNASASLVTFCGKATAFAFLFCPGLADVLTRLWNSPVDTMRRVLSENGIGKFDDLESESTRIAANFPPPIQTLAFSSLTKMTRTLRRQPHLPLGTSNIQWYGYWSERWSGRESDLFYAFVKHFHILVSDYLPPNASNKDRMCVPGLLLVHSQILVNLDATIHREANSQSDSTTAVSLTFDDVLGEPDAIASTLPLPPANAIRIMAENRLIMLIRDFLSERSADHPVARHLFAQSFNDLLQAAARKTSLYDHAACYTLCDFLEEAFLILIRYEQTNPALATLIDTTFWLDVCKKMIGSQNTMTEIRLYAFLYTVWSILCSDPSRKTEVCIEFLLEEEMFERTFNHWCPMVRAYFMRLLCWRVARYDGDASQSDIRIFQKLSERLRTLWSYHLFAREKAEQMCTLPPSTAPSNPAPGRRLLIIRTDTPVAPGGSYLAFDGMLPPPSAPLTDSMAVSKNASATVNVIDKDIRPSSAQSSDFDSEAEREPGLRGFLRGIIGSGRKRSKSRPVLPRSSSATVLPTPSPPSELAPLTRSATDDARIPRPRTSMNKTPIRPAVAHRNFCFKFSLEFSSKMKTHPPINMRLYPPRLPMPAEMLLKSISPSPTSSLQSMCAQEPKGRSCAVTRYAGRALAEWTIVVMECQGFSERRKGEGVPAEKYVETPTLGVEVFRRSG